MMELVISMTLRTRVHVSGSVRSQIPVDGEFSPPLTTYVI